MRVYLGSDHAGYELKRLLLARLPDVGYADAGSYDVVDMGADHYDPEDDYPAYCIRTGERVVADPGSLGVVIGGSGNGEQIAANKVIGVRAALAWNEATARLAREHNNANVVSIGARMLPAAEAESIVLAFLATPFAGDPRHLRRIGQIAAYESPAPAS